MRTLPAGRLLRVMLLIGAVLGAAFAVACGGGDDSEEIGLLHIDAFAINPGDGRVYVASHSGLVRIDDDGVTRLSEDVPDFSSLAITGPDRFFVSGHPDLERAVEGLPLLGLLESTDAGKTWEARSGAGESDFHVLRESSGALLAYDAFSSALLFSDDGGATWELRSRRSLIDFDVHPESPDVLVAVGDEGLIRSQDAGRSWAPLNGVDARFLSWERGDRLWAMDDAGLLRVSADSGVSWQERGRAPEPPSAFLAAEGALYIGAAGGKIYVSEDGGAEWRLEYADG